MKLETLFDTWKGNCAYCGVKLKLQPDAKHKRLAATRDHFIPLSAGGGKGNRNHVLACQPCNLQKGAFDPRIFIKVWHQLDPRTLRAFVEGLDEQKPRRGLAVRIKALLRPQSRTNKKAVAVEAPH